MALFLFQTTKQLITMPNKNLYVAYLRVSTQKQGYSGLGLEAQREIIEKHLRDRKPIAEYVEVESGRHNDRPKLKEALELCRRTGANLIVAKMDRLSRNVAFTSQLLESDVEIVFCDFPQANKMMIHIVSAIAQYEAELTATRTRQALQAKKSRGFTLGNPEHLIKAMIAGNLDRMEALGAYEVAPEDFAVCEYVCTSKMPLQAIVRAALDNLKQEIE